MLYISIGFLLNDFINFTDCSILFYFSSDIINGLQWYSTSSSQGAEQEVLNSCSENDDNAYLPEVVRLDRKPKLGQEFESDAKDARFSVRIYSSKKGLKIQKKL